MADEKISALPSAGSLAGTEPLPIVQGGVTKKTTVQDVANLVATPNLQQVTDEGFTTTNKLKSDNGAGGVSALNNGTIDLTSGGATVNIDALLVTTAYIAKLPDKPTSPQTFAMLSDIGGLDLEVNGTPNVDQTLLNLIEGINIDIADNGTGGVTITSLADRYKTSSITSNTVSNGAKTFTVDANLAYIPLQEVLIVNSPSNHMHGEVTSYSGTTLVVDVKNHTGSGTYATWVINLDGIPVDAITGAGTANEIAYFTGGQVIGSLNTATYPSLTELSYVKGVTSAIQTQINALADTYVIQCSAPILAAPGDSISYHIGVVPANTFSSIDARRAWKFPTAGNVTTVSMILEQVVNASNETVTLYIRNVTTATDYLVGTFTSDFGASTTLKTLFTGLSIAVNTTDDWTFKIVTPAWATNPTSWAMTQLIRVTV